MKKFARDIADGLESALGPVFVPRWLHHAVWGSIWIIWIVGAIGFVYDRLS